MAQMTNTQVEKMQQLVREANFKVRKQIRNVEHAESMLKWHAHRGNEEQVSHWEAELKLEQRFLAEVKAVTENAKALLARRSW